ncbi:DHA2 family efflux MFS transporter permease subunit [Kitasatospora sp. NPDC058170]|uniref:DHA2 family efflux MFS transporter permease subunit n=1 Tax=Kitasatospora sp. NPDC058170 TaxID=3346364 RepID=UPI0036D8B092
MTQTTIPQVQPQAGHPRRWLILGVLVSSLLVILIDNTILNVGLRTIQHDLNATQSEMEWVLDSYILIFAGLMFTFGVLGDRVGRKLLLVIGLVLFGITSVVAALVTEPVPLILARAGMGLGAAMVQPQTLSIIQNVFPPNERGKAIGLWSSFSGIAIAVGPITGGLLLKYFWWGSLFLVNIPVVIVGSIAVMMVVPESRDPKPSRLDPLGVVLSTVGVIGLVYGIIKGGETNDWISAAVLLPSLGGVAVLALFVWLQKRSASPTLDVNLFRNRLFSSGTFALSVTSFALMGGLVFMAYYWQAARGYDALKAGLFALPVAVGMMISAAKSSGLTAKFGHRGPVAGGLAIMGLSLLGWAIVDKDTAVWYLLVISLLFGFGMGGVFAPATALAMSAVPVTKAGAGSAVTNTVRQMAGALGIAVLGSVLAAAYRGKISDTVDTVFPEAARHNAAESIVGTGTEAEKLVAQVQSGTVPRSALADLQMLFEKAQDAFVSAMHVTSIAAGGFALLGAAAVVLAMPSRNPRTE